MNFIPSNIRFILLISFYPTSIIAKPFVGFISLEESAKICIPRQIPKMGIFFIIFLNYF